MDRLKLWQCIPDKFIKAVEDVYISPNEDDKKYWIYLKEGWVAYDGGDDCGIILEDTIKDLKAAIKTIRHKLTNAQKQFEKYLADNDFKITGCIYCKDYNEYCIEKDNVTIEYKVFSGIIDYDNLIDGFKDCWELKAMYEKSRTAPKTRPPRNAASTKLKAMRIDRGLTQAQLAEAAGINMRVLQHYEQGSKSFDSARLDVILKVCIVLKCQISDVLDHKGDIALYKEYSKMFKKESDKA